MVRSTSEAEVLEQLLSKLDGITSRLDAIETKVEAGNQGVVGRAVRFSTHDIGDACGVVSVGHNELIGESGPRREKESDEKRKSRKRRQSLGAKYYTAFIIFYVGLMALSFMDLLPVFAWERVEFSVAETVSVWLGDHMHLPFIFSGVYVVVIFGIQSYMKDREGYDLRTPLALWSLLLALFSIAGSLRTVPVLIKLIQTKGMFHVVCGDSRRDWVIDNPAGMWTMIFVFSKVPELIDTLFIVLRKKKLITLHWYHHITVMTFCWQSWVSFCLNGLVYSSMNLTVHAFMYFFYALTSFGYRPTSFAMYITLIQIAQMLVGTAVTFYVNYHLSFVEPQPLELSMKPHWDPLDPEINTDPSCKIHRLNAVGGALMYSSYLWLFVVFFYVSYLTPKPKSAKDKAKDKAKKAL